MSERLDGRFHGWNVPEKSAPDDKPQGN
jgi:hypothetical protein